MIKLYTAKSNGEIKKTPERYNSLLDIANHYKGHNFLDERRQDVYAEKDGEKIYAKDLYVLIKSEVDKHNKDRQDLINDIFAKRKEELNEKVVSFSNEERNLFWMLHSCLDLYVCDEYGQNLPSGLTFKGVPLSKITVKLSEVPKKIEF